MREYLNIEVIPTCLGRLEALEILPIRSIENLVKSGLSYANAFMVEGLLALGAAIGICLVAVLVRTGWDFQYGSTIFFQDFPSLTLEAAQELAERRIALLGMDTPSPSPVDDPEQGIHKTLLDAGIVLLECLTNLHRIRGNECELIELPPLFKGFSGSPCRAVAVQAD